VFEIPDEEWTRLFEVNLLSGVRLARHHVPRMAARGWGRVVFASSESALQIPTEMVHYGMTKTAQLAVARGMAESVAGTGVTVNCVLPGPTLTEGVEEFLRARAERGEGPADLAEAGRAFIAAARPTSLIGRLAEPDEVANMVVYVASDQASATTGAALRVDGGVVRAIP
jgi:NAD(P)-dependent dehydrogenase (short-subunit alcohol dehydrogenase family)